MHKMWVLLIYPRDAGGGWFFLYIWVQLKLNFMKKFTAIVSFLLISFALLAQSSGKPVIGISSNWGEGSST